MASIYPFYEESEHTEAILVASYKNQNEIQTKVNWAATNIQSFFRGMMVRKRLEHEQIAAVTIQRYVRGWLLRYHLPDLMQEHFDHMCLKFYDKTAARIQATWKGYIFRKYEYCIRDLLEQRDRMAKANERIAQLFKQPFNEFNKNEFEINDEYMRKVHTIIFDRHHLLSTERKKGVLSSKGKKEFAVLEKLLKDMTNWKDYMDEIHDIYFSCSSQKEPVKYKYSDRRLQKQEDYLRFVMNRPYPLNELDGKPINYKTRDFKLSTKITRKDDPPKPITTCGRFRRPIKHIVRDIDSSQNVCCKDFDLIIPHQNRLALKGRRSDYHLNFWYEQCPCRQRENL